MAEILSTTFIYLLLGQRSNFISNSGNQELRVCLQFDMPRNTSMWTKCDN